MTPAATPTTGGGGSDGAEELLTPPPRITRSKAPPANNSNAGTIAAVDSMGNAIGIDSPFGACGDLVSPIAVPGCDDDTGDDGYVIADYGGECREALNSVPYQAYATPGSVVTPTSASAASAATGAGGASEVAPAMPGTPAASVDEAGIGIVDCACHVGDADGGTAVATFGGRSLMEDVEEGERVLTPPRGSRHSSGLNSGGLSSSMPACMPAVTPISMGLSEIACPGDSPHRIPREKKSFRHRLGLGRSRKGEDSRTSRLAAALLNEDGSPPPPPPTVPSSGSQSGGGPGSGLGSATSGGTHGTHGTHSTHSSSRSKKAKSPVPILRKRGPGPTTTDASADSSSFGGVASLGGVGRLGRPKNLHKRGVSSSDSVTVGSLETIKASNVQQQAAAAARRQRRTAAGVAAPPTSALEKMEETGPGSSKAVDVDSGRSGNSGNRPPLKGFKRSIKKAFGMKKESSAAATSTSERQRMGRAESARDDMMVAQPISGAVVGNRRRLGSEPAVSPSKTKHPSAAVGRRSSGDSDRPNANVNTARAQWGRLPTREELMNDAAIRGRLDGLDSMSLGPAPASSLASAPPPKHTSSSKHHHSGKHSGSSGRSSNSGDSRPSSPVGPSFFFYAESGVLYTPRDMVDDMLRRSGGKDPPELILEGFLPLGEDRWTVRIERMPGEAGESPKQLRKDKKTKRKKGGKKGQGRRTENRRRADTGPIDLDEMVDEMEDGCLGSGKENVAGCLPAPGCAPLLALHGDGRPPSRPRQTSKSAAAPDPASAAPLPSAPAPNHSRTETPVEDIYAELEAAKSRVAEHNKNHLLEKRQRAGVGAGGSSSPRSTSPPNSGSNQSQSEASQKWGNGADAAGEGRGNGRSTIGNGIGVEVEGELKKSSSTAEGTAATADSTASPASVKSAAEAFVQKGERLMDESCCLFGAAGDAGVADTAAATVVSCDAPAIDINHEVCTSPIPGIEVQRTLSSCSSSSSTAVEPSVNQENVSNKGGADNVGSGALAAYIMQRRIASKNHASAAVAAKARVGAFSESVIKGAPSEDSEEAIPAAVAMEGGVLAAVGVGATAAAAGVSSEEGNSTLTDDSSPTHPPKPGPADGGSSKDGSPAIESGETTAEAKTAAKAANPQSAKNAATSTNESASVDVDAVGSGCAPLSLLMSQMWSKNKEEKPPQPSQSSRFVPDISGAKGGQGTVQQGGAVQPGTVQGGGARQRPTDSPSPTVCDPCETDSETDYETESESSEDEDEEDILTLAGASCPVDIDEDVFMIDTAEHLQAVHDIAAGALMRGRFDRALEIFYKILQSLQVYLRAGKGDGPCGGHTRLVGATYHNMSIVHMWTGQYDLALQCLDDAVKARKEAHLSETVAHPSVAVSLAKRGLVLFALERYDESLRSLEDALDQRRKLIAFDHLEMGKIHNAIGAVHYRRGDAIAALKSYTAALDIQRLWLEGPIRREAIVFDASVTLANMGRIYVDRAECDMALYVYEEALLLQTSTFRKDHDMVLTTLGNIAFAKAKRGEHAKALQIYRGIHRSQISNPGGAGSKEAIETTGLMAAMHIQLCRYDEAAACLSSVAEWQRKRLREGHPALRNTETALRKIRRMLKDEKKEDDDGSVSTAGQSTF